MEEAEAPKTSKWPSRAWELQTFERIKRYLTFVTGLFECIFFAGVIFGWASLVFILKKEGYFYDLCLHQHNVTDRFWGNGTIECDLQDERFTLLFTVGSFMVNFSTFPCGFMLDHIGTMVTRFLGIFLYTSGTLMIAFCNAAIGALLFPAVSLLAVGGILFLMTNIQVGNLFGTRRSTVITLYNGAFDSSSAVFVLIKVLYEVGLSLRNMFLVISCLSSVHIIRTYLLLPRTHIPFPLPEGYTYGMQCEGLDMLSGTPEEEEEATNQTEPLQEERWTNGQKGLSGDEAEGASDDASPQVKVPKDSEEKSKEEIPSFRSCFLSTLFFTHLLWLSVMQLRHYLFIGTLNPMLSLLAENDAATVFFERITLSTASKFQPLVVGPGFSFQLPFFFCCLFPAPTSDSAASHRLADMKSAVLSLTITITQCILFSICAAIPVLPVQYFTFVLQVINRSFLYGGHAAFTAMGKFPPCHFGKIYGMLMFFSAIVSLLQYACFALVKGPMHGNPIYINIGFIILVSVAYIHPINVHLHCRRETELRETAKTPQVEVPALEEKDNQPTETDI
ncbi:equilibrative nucleobase transporter 1-like [Scyliorhinus torazame]|uniref:equilibrative nucleobase transporter 1-like n=1 Tax=Scyliorhinus torazame TaxID=75743 RepID=UPI003B5CB82C